MNLQIIPFKARHIEAIKPDAPADMLELAKFAERGGYAVTGCVLGDPIGAAGVAVMMPGIGQIWSLFSPFIKKNYRITLMRNAGKMIADAMTECKLHSVVATVDPDDLKACQFVEDLDFRLDRFVYVLRRSGE